MPKPSALGAAQMGGVTAAIVGQFERLHQGATFPMARVLSVSVLRVAHLRTGDAARAEAMRQLLEWEAPNCARLRRLPG